MAKWKEETVERKGAEFEAISAPFKGHSLQELEASYFEARKSKDELDAKLKPVNQVIAVLELLIAEKFAEDDLKTVGFDNGNRITVRFERPITIESRVDFVKWLEATGRAFELTVYAASAKRIAKEYREEEKKEDLPPGLKEGEPVPVLTYTRGGK